MAIKLIRQESETPNITNYDDARMARYAYGGYDGYVKSRGTEIASEVNGTTFVVKSGVLVLQGWETEIDANGVSISVTAADASLRYTVVYLEINRAADTVQIKTLSDTAGYPQIPESDDLTNNVIGTARLPLYRFTAQSGVIRNVEKLVKAIEYVGLNFDDLKSKLTSGDFVPKKSEFATKAETPIFDEDSQKIATTEWVNDKAVTVFSGHVLADNISIEDVNLTTEILQKAKIIAVGCSLPGYHIGIALVKESRSNDYSGSYVTNNVLDTMFYLDVTNIEIDFSKKTIRAVRNSMSLALEPDGSYYPHLSSGTETCYINNIYVFY